ncbi:hypothetical protein [Caballeronia sp. LZ035]|uniref:hypothetical protein n=1 Tax=Caballeronia sp. LZ035 TaxID=3038568 RepID=UPI00285A7DD6|nr:hypothetical protein [Caballeronia sp. LZ035]MDR5763505.1 hypothetical protein [Caballeronia sp. LZ035]
MAITVQASTSVDSLITQKAESLVTEKAETAYEFPTQAGVFRMKTGEPAASGHEMHSVVKERLSFGTGSDEKSSGIRNNRRVRARQSVEGYRAGAVGGLLIGLASR